MPAKKLTSALEKTLSALLPLNPEERRRVIEAAHALIEIGAGTKQGGDARRGGPDGKTSPRGRGR
jgi:hypothetical protein